MFEATDEKKGLFPTTEQEVQINFDVKPIGGRRPIAGFRALCRIWGRCSKRELSAWEDAWANDNLFNTGNGRTVTDAVWRCEARAELATAQGMR